MDNNLIVKKLNSINWNFDFAISYEGDLLYPFNCRKYYSYPATFIPEIPYALIEILSKKGDLILDPFGGIGTTFIQALLLERIPFSCDINPVASSVCRTLYLLFNPKLDKERIRKQLLQFSEGYDKEHDYTNYLVGFREGLIDWFEKETRNEISYLLKCLDKIKDQTLQETMKLILSSILVKLSSQNKGWAYIADNVKPKKEELKRKAVFDQYRASINNLLNDIIKYEDKLPATYSDFYSSISSDRRIFDTSLINAQIEKEKVNLVITSPPYPRMIDYVKSQRLSFNMFNENYNDFTVSEIGARNKRSRRDCLETYESEIKRVNSELFRVLKPRGYLCVVFPDYDFNDNRRIVIDNIINDYSKLGFTKVFEVGRYIPSHKRTLSIQWATLVNERIYIFQKG